MSASCSKFQWRAAVGFAAIFVVLAGCAKDDDDSNADPQSQYAGRLSAAICDHLEPCCTKNGLGFDHGGCELGGAGFFQVGVDNAKKHGMRFDAQAADQCIAATAEAAQACKGAGSADVCARVFVGTKPPGDPCTDSMECAPSADGKGSCYGAPSGFCVVLKAAAVVGDACGVAEGKPPALLADCAHSALQCGLISKKCEPLAAIGAPCPGFTQCTADAYCAASQKCEAKLGLGATCTKGDECASAGCVHGKCVDNELGGATPCTGEK